MIQVVQIAPAALKALQHQGRDKITKTVLFFSACFVFFSLVFDIPIGVAMSCIVLVVGIFAVTGWQDRRKRNADFEAGVKIVRRGRVVRVTYFHGQLSVAGGRLAKSVSITMEPERVEGDYPEHDTFTLISGLGAMYYKPDYGLFSGYKSLQGKEVEIEYFPHTGAVLAFREPVCFY